METTLTPIGSKWEVLIVRDLLTGTKRFGELRRSMSGVSQKVLTSRLRAMEADGLVSSPRCRPASSTPSCRSAEASPRCSTPWSAGAPTTRSR